MDHSKFRDIILGSVIYYSVDLKSASDRLPIEFIISLLKSQLPANYVDSWKDVMVGYPFRYQGCDLSYNCGTPTGAYSSFNSFTLAHHYLIYYCCKVNGKS